MQQSYVEMCDFVRDNRISRRQLCAILLDHSDLRRPDYFTFKLDDIAEQLYCEAAIARKVLGYYSIKTGGLKEFKFEHFFLGNPVWYKPIIDLESDTYFCALPQLFFTFSPNSIDQLLGGDSEALEAVSRRRSSFLEDSIASLFEGKFPGAVIVRGFRWAADDRIYETDLVVKYDTQLLIIEAKSGKVTEAALRGAIGRVKRHLKELILEPAIQANRLAGYAEAFRRDGSMPPGVQITFPFDVSDVHRVTKLSVTLEIFGAIKTNIREMGIEEIIGEEIPSIVSMTLSDLRAVFDVLESPAQIIHYIVRRGEIQESVRYFGDEMDLLGCYLVSGLMFGDLERGHDRVSVSMMSKVVDSYYAAVDNGFSRKKPRRLMTKWFSDIT